MLLVGQIQLLLSGSSVCRQGQPPRTSGLCQVSGGLECLEAELKEKRMVSVFQLPSVSWIYFT